MKKIFILSINLFLSQLSEMAATMSPTIKDTKRINSRESNTSKEFRQCTRCPISFDFPQPMAIVTSQQLFNKYCSTG